MMHDCSICTDVDYLPDDAVVLSGIRASLNVSCPTAASSSHIAAISVAESNNEPLQLDEDVLTADPSDGLFSYEMYTSPQPNECLNDDIWLNSAAADLGSPVIPRFSGSCTVLHEHAN